MWVKIITSIVGFVPAIIEAIAKAIRAKREQDARLKRARHKKP
jgi:hypothetical protein